MLIRPTTDADREVVRHLHFSAFSEEERDVVSDLAVNLMMEKTEPGVLSLATERDGELVGHIVLSPVSLDKGPLGQGYILAPVAVLPQYHKQKIGSKLITHGLEQVAQRGAQVIFVYGDPKYYGRFGFSADLAEPYIPPHPLEYPFGWQAIARTKDACRVSSVQVSCPGPLDDPGYW